MMRVEKTQLDGVLVIALDAFEDFRGQYVETYNEDAYRKAGIDVHFRQDDISVSSRHVLRGIHGDAETWKLISCLHGSFYLMASTQAMPWLESGAAISNVVQVASQD